MNYPSEYFQRLLTLVYRWIDVDVCRKTTDRGSGTSASSDSLAGFAFSADYHQHYLAKNPNGYC